MSILFEETEIHGMTLANRFVRSATWEGLAADDGTCTPQIVDLMIQLADGEVGLIITGHAYVRPDGYLGPRQLAIYDDHFIKGLRKMTEAVHGRGGKIVLQISHAGFYAYAKWIRQMPLAPSDVKGLTKSPRKEMSSVDIQEVAEAFGQAAERAKKAGFDGVQIHAAHSYLLSQFLSPVFNKREDLYGGTVENRARFLLEVLLKIKATLGPDYPILVKMNSQDFLTGGLTLDDSLQVGLMLFESGIYAIELSGGTHVSGKLNPVRTGITSENKEAYFRDAGKAFKKKMDIPIILVGGIRSYHVAERIAEEGVADYISMSRPLIREPRLIKRWKAGDRRKSTCISDNQCFNPATAGEGMHCVVERKQKKDRHDE